jgi:hypothetical protein
MDFPQPGGREQGGAEGIAMAHIVTGGGRIAKQVVAHHVGGEHHGAGEAGQHPGQGGLAAGGRADQQVAAQ